MEQDLIAANISEGASANMSMSDSESHVERRISIRLPVSMPITNPNMLVSRTLESPYHIKIILCTCKFNSNNQILIGRNHRVDRERRVVTSTINPDNRHNAQACQATLTIEPHLNREKCARIVTAHCEYQRAGAGAV
jgi:hypothetical protein